MNEKFETKWKNNRHAQQFAAVKFIGDISIVSAMLWKNLCSTKTFAAKLNLVLFSFYHLFIYLVFFRWLKSPVQLSVTRIVYIVRWHLRALFYHNSALCPLRHHVTGHPRAHGEQCSQIRVSFYRKAINDFQSASLGNGVDQIFILWRAMKLNLMWKNILIVHYIGRIVHCIAFHLFGKKIRHGMFIATAIVKIEQKANSFFIYASQNGIEIGRRGKEPTKPNQTKLCLSCK